MWKDLIFQQETGRRETRYAVVTLVCSWEWEIERSESRSRLVISSSFDKYEDAPMSLIVLGYCSKLI